MRISGLGRYALCICSASAFLAGCGGSQPPIGRAAMPQGAASRMRTASTSGDCPALSGGTGILPDGDFSQALDPGDSGPVYAKGYVFAPDWVVSKGNINFDGAGVWGGGLNGCGIRQAVTALHPGTTRPK